MAMADKTKSKRTVTVTKKTVKDLKPKPGKSGAIKGGAFLRFG
jgi:hypothetical protein